MNMPSVLHRRSNSQTDPRPRRLSLSALSPSPRPPGDGSRTPARWPTGAKALVGALVVATVLSTVGTAFAISSNSDGSNERELEARVASLLSERDDALDAVRAIDLELSDVREQLRQALDGNVGLTDQVAELQEHAADLTDQRAEAVAAADALTVRVGDLNSAVEELEGTAASQQATIDELQATIRELGTKNETLDAALRTANQRVTSATKERDALAKLFPIGFDIAAVNAGLVGRHSVDLAKVHCSGHSSCASLPPIKELTISRTAEGYLRLDVPGFVEGGLSQVGGALHLAATSSTAIPNCSGTARHAQVTMTLFPTGHQIANGATRAVVEAVMNIEAPATGDCPAALAFYSLELTPKR